MKRLKQVLAFLGLSLMASVAFAAQELGHQPDMTHRMMMLAVQLGVILFAARMGNMLFEKIRMPGVLGELAAGMIIGPFALGGVSFFGFPHGLIPYFSEGFPIWPELYGFCSVAAIVLLFIVGLETDVHLFKRYYLAGSAVGIGGVVTSFVFGDVIAVVFGQWVLGKSIGFMDSSALFLGAIATATSVGISARILSEKRKIGSPEGVTILAGAVIDDVLGIILLAIILGVLSASKATGTVNWAHIGVIAAKAVGIWLVATIVGLFASRRISILLKLFKEKSSIATMAFGLALILAGLFEEAGLAMIIGAYVMGLSLSQTDISLVIQEKLSPIHNFIVPIFFCVMGMLVDFRTLSSPQVIAFGVAYAIVAIFAKILGGGIPALFFNFNLRGALRIGFGMVPRAEVALIMAGIGFSKGLFPTEIFGVVIIMMIITMVIAPFALVVLFKNPAPGTRKDVSIREKETVSFSFPSQEIAELLVGKLIAMFEVEGFYVNLVDIKQRLYQMRRDTVMLSFRHSREEIVFDCDIADVALVNAVMYEVLAELEKMLKGLQKPIDRQAIGRRVQTPVAGAMKEFKLSNYLTPNLVTPGLKGNTKEEIINELLDIVQQDGQIRDIEEARKAIWDREESMSTGMQYGIAIPHGRTDAVKQLVCAIGLKQDGIDFGSIDGEPSKIFVLTLSPKAVASPQVQFMSTISQVLNSPEIRERVLSCSSRRELYRVLTREPAAGLLK